MEKQPQFSYLKVVRAVVSAIEWLARAVAAIPAFFAILATLIITVNVVLRYLFNAPLTFEFETVQVILVCFLWLPLAHIWREERYIAVEIFTEKLSWRTRTITKIVGCIIGLFYFSVITKVVWHRAMESFAYGARSTQLSRFPMGPQELIVPIGAGLLCLQLIITIVRSLARLIRNEGQNGKKEEPLAVE